jgi:hypothetical protein
MYTGRARLFCLLFLTASEEIFLFSIPYLPFTLCDPILFFYVIYIYSLFLLLTYGLYESSPPTDVCMIYIKIFLED